MLKGIRVFTFIAVSFLLMHLVTDWSDEQMVVVEVASNGE